MDSYDPFRTMTASVSDAAKASLLVKQNDLFSVQAKRDKTPVTIADLAGQILILRTLIETAPEETIFAEEDTTQLKDDSISGKVREIVEEVTRKSFARSELEEIISFRGTPHTHTRWFVDPIDGTKGYIRGLFYCVAVARVVGGAIERSWIATPDTNNTLDNFSNRVFRAIRGEGVTSVSLNGNDKVKLPKRTAPVREGTLTIVASRSHDQVNVPENVIQAGTKIKVFEMDSQAKYAAIAAGHADIYPRHPSEAFGHFYCWDHAPGALLVMETGGVATDLMGARLDWQHGRRMVVNQGIFASATPELHRMYQYQFESCHPVNY